MTMKTRPQIDRRQATGILTAAAAATMLRGTSFNCLAEETASSSLDGVVGITTGGGLGRQRERGEQNLMTVPKYIREVLGMRLIDLNTRWTTPYTAKELEKAREVAESAGCYFSNLKVNYNVGDLYSTDLQVKNRAMSEGRKQIDAAKILGTRWIRFTIPKQHAAKPIAHIELAGYAQQQGIKLLIENGGGMNGDPASIASLVKAIGSNVAACPDTGNWADEIREEGLRRSFVGAASCDFKVFTLGEDRRHAPYDLKRCFEIGWDAGFRGPWVIEHMKEDTKNFARDTVLIREMLETWIVDAKA